MRDMQRKRQTEARSRLWQVDPGEVAALRQVEAEHGAETITALVKAVARGMYLVPNVRNRDAVMSLAAVKSGWFYLRTGNVNRSALAAISAARRTVTAAYAGDASLTAMAEDSPGSVEDRIRDGARSSMARDRDSRPADAAWDYSPSDALAYVTEHGSPYLRTVVRAYLRHEKDGCDTCAGLATRAIAPSGIVAHLKGFRPAPGAAGKPYRAEYSRFIRAAATAPREALSLLDTRGSEPQPAHPAEAESRSCYGYGGPSLPGTMRLPYSVPVTGPVARSYGERTVPATIGPVPASRLRAAEDRHAAHVRETAALLEELRDAHAHICDASGERPSGDKPGEGIRPAPPGDVPATGHYAGTLPGGQATVRTVTGTRTALTGTGVPGHWGEGDEPATAAARGVVRAARGERRFVVDSHGVTVRAMVRITGDTYRAMTPREDNARAKAEPVTGDAEHVGLRGTDSAPIGERDRSLTTGMVRTFKADTSPRKKGGDATGPTVTGTKRDAFAGIGMTP